MYLHSGWSPLIAVASPISRFYAYQRYNALPLMAMARAGFLSYSSFRSWYIITHSSPGSIP